MHQVSEDVLAVLSAAELTGNSLLLTGQLDRKTYEKVAKVIEMAGGKWNRKAKAHLFDGPAEDALDQLLLTGQISDVKQELGQFDSPPAVVDRLIELARIEHGMKVYEPSCGVGNIVKALEVATGKQGTVFGHEIDPKRHKQAVTNCFSSFGAGGIGLGDFLTMEPRPTFDRVVMNPPFARQQDIAHVMHASKFLKPGGRLVSVMGAGITFRQDNRTQRFRDFLQSVHGEIEAMPAESFKAAGTGVHTVIVHFNI